jgi:hypothetical protein
MRTTMNQLMSRALFGALGVIGAVCPARTTPAADYIVQETLRIDGEGGFDFSP